MTRSPAPSLPFLLEIRTEEIPARMLDGALDDLSSRLHAGLVGERLLEAAAPKAVVRAYGTPRRLALCVDGVRPVQPDEEVELTGPPVRSAFDAHGRPTRAAEGFARAQGIAVGDLVRLTTPKGECVGVRKRVPGRPSAEVLGRIVPAIVMATAFPKTMRWGTGEHLFVRPIHGVVALLGGEVVPMSIAGIASDRVTLGHRLAGPAPIRLEGAGHYLDALRAGRVLADPAERGARIEALLEEAARAAGGRIAGPPGAPPDGGDPHLVREVTHMVEWPVVLTGSFDPAFLDLPAEIPMTAMRHHQKFFPLRGPDGRLLDRFLAVANLPEDRSGAIRRGHEWVLRARLADARFFWEEDRRRSLSDHSAGLERLMFHEKLGSYRRKADRIGRLAEAIAPAFETAGQRIDPRATLEAARLCKADLTTLMVGEFPELQGIVGALYARADGLPVAVADAIYGHYLPRSVDDVLPSTPEGAVVSLADRLDTQAGIFLIGIVPTGSRDPYALRRSVQGVCRILVERRVRLSLDRLAGMALEGYGDAPVEGAVPVTQACAAWLEFCRGRLEHLGEAAGHHPDAVRAALAAGADDPFDARLRMAALDALRVEPNFMLLATAHKRIKNIVKDQPVVGFDPSRLREDAETALHREFERVRPQIEAAAQRPDYPEALRSLARIAPALDRFFEKTLVLAKEARVRSNRVALLRSIAGLFLRIGDFSEMVVEGDGGEVIRRAATGRRPA